MFSLKIILHTEITDIDIKEIIEIKSFSWPYSYENQLNWLNENLKAGDVHLLLKKGNNTVAYLNLINIDLEFNNNSFKALGVGNVCSTEKGKGYGNELMKQANQYLQNENRIGLLFCKKGLINFYQKVGWKKIEKNNYQVVFDNTNIETMIYNCSLKFENLGYRGRPF